MNFIMLILTLFNLHSFESQPKYYFLEGQTLKELTTISIPNVRTMDIQIFIRYHQSPKSLKIDGIKQKIVSIKKAQKKQLKLNNGYYKVIWKVDPDIQSSKHMISLLSKSGKTFEQEFNVTNEPDYKK
jgi:hypothetical protein